MSTRFDGDWQARGERPVDSTPTAELFARFFAEIANALVESVVAFMRDWLAFALLVTSEALS